MGTELSTSLRDWRVGALTLVIVLAAGLGLIWNGLAFLPLVAAPVVLSALLGRPTTTALIGVVGVLAGLVVGLRSRQGPEVAVELVVAGILAVILAMVVRRWRRRVEAEEQRFRMLAENASDVVLQLGADDEVRWASPAVAAVLGWAPERLIGRAFRDLLDPAARPIDLANDPGTPAHFATMLRLPEGGHRWMRCVCHATRDESTGELTRVISMSDAEQEHAAEERFRVLVAEAPIPMCFGPTTGHFLEFNDALCAFFELPADELRGRTWIEFTHPDDVDADQHLTERMIRGELDTYRLQKRYLTSSGAQKYGDLTVSRLTGRDGDETWAVAQIVDVTAEVQARQRLEALANFDAVTGLYSRSWIMRELDHRLAAGERVTAFFIDVSEYLALSRTMGYESADTLVAELADSLRAVVPVDIPLGRFEGYRFIALAADLSDSEATEFAEQMLDSIAEETTINGLRLSRWGSIGVASSSPTSTSQQLLQEADRALAMAHAAGRSRLFIKHVDDAHGEQDSLELESELRHALDRREFVVHYQPQVRLSDDVVVGHEALVRWQHPTRGLLAPAGFIGVLERVGLIDRLDLQVLEIVCSDLAAAHDVLGHVSVNVSSLELADGQWWTRAAEIITESSADPRSIIMELTEGQMLQLTPDARAALEAMRCMGIEVHVDDFGTGFASVGLLTSVDVSGVKLDRSFVAALGEPGERAADVARGIVQLADALHLVTIAEGMETAEQARQVAEIGWQIGQGNYFGEPAALSTFTRR